MEHKERRPRLLIGQIILRTWKCVCDVCVYARACTQVGEKTRSILGGRVGRTSSWWGTEAKHKHDGFEGKRKRGLWRRESVLCPMQTVGHERKVPAQQYKKPIVQCWQCEVSSTLEHAYWDSASNTMSWHMRAQPQKKQRQKMRLVEHLREQPPKKWVQAMQWVKHLRKPQKKRVQGICVFYCHSKNPYHVGQVRAPDFIWVWSTLGDEMS